MEAAREEIADRQVNYEDVGRRPQSFEPIAGQYNKKKNIKF